MSELEQPISTDQYDVIILGGGLAGLTLALQLNMARPTSRILVVEKQKHPVQEAAHKVGESTVEIATEYIQRLGLGEHLRTQQLRKFGLRFFFSTEDNQDIARRVELGLAAPHFIPSFQLDRGRFENMLGLEVAQRNIPFLDGCKVEQVVLDGETQHTVYLRRGEEALEIHARWVVDASGRSSLLKRQLDLADKGPHRANAVWFRIGNKIDIDRWSTDPAWHERITDGERYLSTNHLCGKGYWVWLIPLASGSTSVGIVTDPTFHSFDTLNRFERALAWLRQYEPQCARAVEDHQADVQDFRVMKDYSYSCRQVYSGERWCLTGEAGAFIDPLYSPGSDFIAISNSLVADLIQEDLAGNDIRGRARAYNLIYLSMANAWFNIYQQQYELLGNAQVMVAKYIWDTAVYWGSFSLLYFHDKIRSLAHNRTLAINLHRSSVLGTRVQAFLHEWADIDRELVTDLFRDHYNPLDFMKKFHAGISATLTATEFDAEFVANIRLLERIAGRMVSKVIDAYATSSASDEAVQKQIQRWQTDPLLSECIALYKEGAESDPVNGDWIYTAHLSRHKAEIAR